MKSTCNNISVISYSYSFLHLNVKFTKLWLCLWRVFFRSSLWTDTLQSKDYHYEDIWPEDVIHKGYGGVDCVEAGGPPAGAGKSQPILSERF